MSPVTTACWRVIAVSSTVLLMAGAAPAAADSVDDGPPPEPEGGISAGDLRDSVHRFDLDGTVDAADLDGTVHSLGDARSENEDVIVLETDILFTPNSWELPGEAGPRVVELVEEVPEGAAVAVHGHTDSTPVGPDHDFDNEQLSERRAQAVSDVLAEERSDLELDVAGFGAEEPAVAEDEQDASTFAANRRVEIRYGD